jgi:hypothetical protein
MNAPVPKYSEKLEQAVQEDARRLDARADELSGLPDVKPDVGPQRMPNAERVAQLRGYATHLRAMSAVRMRAKYQT